LAERRLAAFAGTLAAIFIGLTYLPDIGHGFLKDDFAWIAAARRLASARDLFLSDSSGTFYRPLVTLSFLIDDRLHGLRPFGYALTNLALLAATAVVIGLLFRTLGVSLLAATIAACLWLLNPHGINMSLLWISGRTSLLMALFASASLLSFARGWTLPGLLFLLASVLSKEDALLVPVIVVAVMWAQRKSRSRTVAVVALMAIVVIFYFLLRVNSHALTAATAPSFYRLTWDPSLIVMNALGYLDRSATVFAVMCLLASVIYKALPRVNGNGGRLLTMALIWFAAAIFITVRVPVRSSLYAVFPSIAAALAFAVLIDALREAATRDRGDRVLVGLVAAVVLAFPIYRSRNARWVLAADVSGSAAQAIAAERERLPQAGLVTLEDEPVRFANFQDAFGDAAPEALRLFVGPGTDARIVPRGDRSTANVESARFVLESGRVRRTK
jgi:hypothetical protein